MLRASWILLVKEQQGTYIEREAENEHENRSRTLRERQGMVAGAEGMLLTEGALCH